MHYCIEFRTNFSPAMCVFHFHRYFHSIIRKWKRIIAEEIPSSPSNMRGNVLVNDKQTIIQCTALQCELH